MSLTNEDLLAISDLLDKKLDEKFDEKLKPVYYRLDNLEADMKEVKEKVNVIGIKLENETNHNLQLLAENHMNLVDKLNQAIRVSDKTLLYEVQISGLKSKVENLEKEIREIKSKIA